MQHVYLEPRYQLFRDGLLDQGSQSTAGRFLHMLVVVQDMLQQALHHEKEKAVIPNRFIPDRSEQLYLEQREILHQHPRHNLHS